MNIFSGQGRQDHATKSIREEGLSTAFGCGRNEWKIVLGTGGNIFVRVNSNVSFIVIIYLKD